MGSYYYTAGDRKLAEVAAVDLRNRLEFDAEAKRGQRWKLDGENKTWQELVWFFDEWKQTEVAAGSDARSLLKLGNRITFQAFLKLLAEQIDLLPF